MGPATTASEDFRSVVLRGANVSSYKFALAKWILSLAEAGATSASLEELPVPFSRELCAHIQQVDTQSTSSGSRFLDACRHFNAGTITHDELVTTTALLGVNNVIFAFHVVDSADVKTCGPTLKDMPSDGCVGRHVPGIPEPSGCPGAVWHVRSSSKRRVGIRPTDALGLWVNGDGPTRRQCYGALTAWAGRCGGRRRRRRRLRRDSDRCGVVGRVAGGGGAQCDQREGPGQHRTSGSSTGPGGGVGSDLSSPVCVGFSVHQPVCSGEVYLLCLSFQAASVSRPAHTGDELNVVT